jgi:hypothetical protein
MEDKLMLFTNKRLRLYIISIILVFLIMSCNLMSGINNSQNLLKAVTPTVETPLQTLQPSTANSNEIVFTEQDVVEWIKKFSSENPDVKLTDPVATLENGICKISAVIAPPTSSDGNSILQSLSGNVFLEIKIKVDENHHPIIEIQSLKFDAIDLPGFMLDQISALINQSLLSSMESELGDTTVNQVTIENGKIIISVTQ